MAKKVVERSKPEHPAIESIKERVRERLETLNLSMNEASSRGRMGLTYIYDIVNDKNRNPQKTGLQKMAEIFECDVAYLTGEQETPRAQEIQATRPVAPINGSSVKLFNIGLTDPEGFFKADNANSVPFVSPVQQGGPGVYCLTVPDDTMAPRYGFGEVVVVNPRKPVSKGGFAVVRMSDDRLIIREIVTIAPDRVVVKCFASPEEVELPRQSVKSLERIIASCELV